MTYVHGATTNTAQVARKTADQVRADLEHLRRIEAQILAETAAKEAELARIKVSRKRLAPVATYAPTPEQLAYRDAHQDEISKQPKPRHGGSWGLELATREAEQHEWISDIMVRARK